MQKLLYASFICLFLSCSKSSNSPSPLLSAVESREYAVQQIISTQVDIQPAIMPEQLKIKTLLFEGIGLVRKYNYEYDSKGRITNITNVSNGNINSFFFEAKYNDEKKTVSENGILFNTDVEGRIVSLADEPTYKTFVYKNGYPLEKSGAYLNKFDSNGNIIRSERKDALGALVFEYTNFPNNIRQEITSTQAIQTSFRDIYAGKYSTNLIKKCTLDKLPNQSVRIEDELNFDYEFDAKNRVSKMTIKRLSDNKFFTYEYTYY